MSARAHAQALLDTAGWHGGSLGVADEHPALAWAASGLMAVTGPPDGSGLMCPVPVAAAADGASLALASMAGVVLPRGAALLGQRARLMGLRRAGAASPGGACRLLRTRDGWLAVSLARAEDWASVAAWMEAPVVGDWEHLAACVRHHAADALVARGRLLGLPVARADQAPRQVAWCEEVVAGAAAAPRGQPVVVDLSSLWAGPLCGALLQRAGARVIKVESQARPDGARFGHGGFFDFLNGGKSSIALDLAVPDGVAALRRLIAGADIVIESTRPRALRQLGIDAEQILAAQPGLTWVSITGHGRQPPCADWVGFGDDAGAAGGLSRAMAIAHGQPVVCGDAIADPLTGLHAAVVAWGAWRRGGGRIMSLSLSGVAAHCAAMAGPDADLAAQARDWAAHAARINPPLMALPAPIAPARALGADTRAVLGALEHDRPDRNHLRRGWLSRADKNARQHKDPERGDEGGRVSSHGDAALGQRC